MEIPGNTALSDEALAGQIERLDALANKWRHLLGLQAWRLTHEYSRLPLAGHGNSLSKATENPVMTCSADWRYLHALIAADMEQIAQQSDADLEFQYVHELMHIFLNEVRQPDTRPNADQYDWLDHEEHCATVLALAFLNVDRQQAKEAPESEQPPA